MSWLTIITAARTQRNKLNIILIYEEIEDYNNKCVSLSCCQRLASSQQPLAISSPTTDLTGNLFLVKKSPVSFS